MRSGFVACVVAGCICSAMVPSAPAWTSVAPGIEYQEFQTSDPNRLFVARMSRDNPQCFVDTTLGGSRLGVSETIGSQASRYDDAVSYWHEDWGLRNDVVVAVNGDFLDTAHNYPLLGQVMSGWYMKEILPGEQRFYYTLAQDLAIGGIGLSSNRVQFTSSGASRSVNGVNRARETDELIVYTHHFNSTTGTDNTGTEVLVEMSRPMLVASSADPPLGVVRQVRQNAGSTQIPFDHIVLSGVGTAATWLNANAHVGDPVAALMLGYGQATKPYASLGGGEVFLGNGQVLGGQNVRHPRTAIAYNDDYLFFVVCDGRSGVSVGMTMTEIGTWCLNTLGATWGINQDGGGSSTMIVNGVLKNDPSDGSQRAVVNGVFMGVAQPKQQSTTYNSGDSVKTTTANLSVRLGPGTNYLSLGTIAKGTTGTVLDHHLRGIYAKGAYWWKCDFGTVTGWVSGTYLSVNVAGSNARFTQHPAAQNICVGGNAAFSVAATGTGGLGYQWRRNGSNLSDDATYSGTATATLVVHSVSTDQNASYRCVVTDSVGSTTSYSAPLYVMSPTTVVVQPQPLIDPRVPRGTDVLFTAKGKGEGAVSYRWQKNGANLSDSSKYAGTGTASLTVMSVDTADEGTYSCRITGSCDTVSTNGAGLVVYSTDFNRDGNVDQADFGHLQACLTGIAAPQEDPACQDANVDGGTDIAVDVFDLAAFLNCMTGPGVARLPGC